MLGRGGGGAGSEASCKAKASSERAGPGHVRAGDGEQRASDKHGVGLWQDDADGTSVHGPISGCVSTSSGASSQPRMQRAGATTARGQHAPAASPRLVVPFARDR
jgi:hypothetical protein